MNILNLSEEVPNSHTHETLAAMLPAAFPVTDDHDGVFATWGDAFPPAETSEEGVDMRRHLPGRTGGMMLTCGRTRLLLRVDIGPSGSDHSEITLSVDADHLNGTSSGRDLAEEASLVRQSSPGTTYGRILDLWESLTGRDDREHVALAAAAANLLSAERQRTVLQIETLLRERTSPL